MSQFSSSYPVARATGICAATGNVIEPGSPCIATLCETDDDAGLERRDFSIEAWEGGARPERLFSYWRTVVPRPEERRKLLVDDAVLMDLFERLAEDERPQRIAFRFVLALILMRKRLLKFVGREGEGEAERWLVAPKGADPDAPPMAVINPHLTDDDVRSLTDELSEILEGEV